MEPRMFVVGRTPAKTQVVVRQIEPFLSGRVKVERLREGEEPSSDAGLIVAADAGTAARMRTLHSGSRIVAALWTLLNEDIRSLKSIAPGSTAMVAGEDAEETTRAIKLLRKLLLDRIELVPYAHRNHTAAVTIVMPGAGAAVDCTQRCHHIKGPVLAPCTIMEVLLALDLYDANTHRMLNQYARLVVPLNCDMQVVLDRFCCVQQCLRRLPAREGEAALHFDGHDRIFLVTGDAAKLLNRPACRLSGRDIGVVLGWLGIPRERQVDKRINWGGRPLSVHVHFVETDGKHLGGVLRLHEVKDDESRHKHHPEQAARFTSEDILGDSEAITVIREIPHRLANSALAVLITGESGTGKELLAQAIHNASSRRAKPFVSVNCAAIPETLFESELFGYEEGAFTGARKGGKAGIFECAHGGTVFLDEIGDMPPAEQARLLRVLEDGESRRLGGHRVKRVDVRIIAATNRNLDELVRKGEFRADLYYRLNVIPVCIPPLRAHREDIPVLAQRFLDELGDRRALPEELLQCLMAYTWPGNVRELKNCIEYMVTVAAGPFTVADLPGHIADALGLGKASGAGAARQGNHSNWANGLGMVGGGRIQALGPNDMQYSPGTGEGMRLSAEQRYLLRAVAEANSRGYGIGRRRLAKHAQRDAVVLTESEIRRLLQEMQAQGLVRIGRGRAGVRLTEKGRGLAGWIMRDSGVVSRYQSRWLRNK